MHDEMASVSTGLSAPASRPATAAVACVATGVLVAGVFVVGRVAGSWAPGAVLALVAAGMSLAAFVLAPRLRRGGREPGAPTEPRPAGDVVDAIRDGVFAIDRQLRFTYANAHAAKYMGVPKEAVVGCTLTDLFPTAVETVFYEQFQRALREDSPVRFEARSRTLGRWFEVSTFPSGGGLAVHFRDVTARRAAAAALAENEARLRIALEAGRLGTWELDTRTGVFSTSEGYNVAHGLAPDAQFSMDVALQGIHPDDRERTSKAVMRALSSNRDYDAEYRFTTPDGIERWLHSFGRCVRSDDGTMARLIGVTQDVTARKRAETALQESEARFRTLADSAPVFIWVMGVDLSLEFLNREGLEFVGVDTLDELQRADRWREMVDPGDLASELGPYMNAEVAREPFRVQVRLKRHDGEWRWAQSVGVPRIDAEGRLLGWVGCTYDVTPLRQVEDELRRRNAELETLLHILPVGLAIAHDARTERVALNRHFEELLGLPHGHDGLCPGPGRDRVPFSWHRDGRPLAQADLPMHRACSQGEPILGEELQIRFDDGATRHLLVNAAPLFDANGVVCGAVGAHMDVTQLREAEAALRDSQERLDLAQEAGRVGVFDWTFATNELIWTEGTERLFGLAPGTFEGRFEYWQSRVEPEDVAAVMVSIGERLLAEEPETSVEYRAILPDGSRRWLRSNARIEYDHGVARRMIGVTYDVDEQRRATEALRDADRRKDEFLAMLAHELRNPLAPIRTAAELLRRVDAADPRSERARSIIERQVGHMARLLDDLLDISRITRGKITLRRETLALQSAIEHGVETVRELVDARRHTLELALPPEPLLVSADGARLVQVFANLVGNAAKFSPPGSWIGVSAERVGREVVVRVRDDGAGISPELVPSIFDLFVQGDLSLDRQRGGLGIGLTLVRSLVELHGGRVEAHSAGIGHGAEFVVRLPSLAQHDPVADLAPAVSATNGRLRVLVVEDNDDAAESLRMLLELGGHQVLVAHSGAMAVEMAEVFPAEVALVDLGLPGLDGFEVVRRLRALDPYRRAIIVALSGYGRDDDKQRALEAGFDHHLTKPVEMTVLQQVIVEHRGTAAAH